MRIYCYLLGFLSFFFLNTTYAQSFKATAEFNTLPMGQPFQITYKLETLGQPSGFMPPNFGDAFNVMSGPNQSSQMININGQMSGSISIGYVVVAQKLGKFTLPPATITSNGKRVASNALTIEVVKGVGGNNAPAQVQKIPPVQSDEDDTPAEYQKEFAESIKMQAMLAKKSVYVGEQVRLVYRLYTRNTLTQPEQTKPPVYEGFWTEDLQPGKAIQQDAMLNGRQYNAYDIKKVVLFPQKAGTLTIPEYELQANVERKTGRKIQSLIDQFFGNRVTTEEVQHIPYRFRSEPVSLEVKPLPEQGKPLGFTGAVGEFVMETHLNKKNAATGEPFHLSITFSGNGNLKMLEAPKLILPASFETYEPESSDNITKNTDNITGSRTFDYTITPNEVGNFEISPIKFYFFNPETERYDSLSSSAFTINVTKGSGTKSTDKDNPQQPLQLKNIETENPSLESLSEPFLTKNVFNGLYFFPILCFAGWLVYYRRRKLKQPDEKTLRLQNANKMVQQKLSVAQKHLANGDSKAFHKEIVASIWGYLGDKLAMKTSEFSQERIQQVLAEKDIQEDTIQSLLSIISTCEMALFSPVSSSEKMQTVLDTTAKVMTEVESSLNKTV